MNNKVHRMIYLANEDLFQKTKEMKSKYHLNISSLIRDCLETEYNRLKDLEKLSDNRE
jgi:hypothetical protein